MYGLFVEVGPTQIFLSNFFARCFHRSELQYFFFSFFFFLVYLLGCARLHAAQNRWVGGAWAIFFLSIFWQVLMIGVRCTSFFVSSDVLARTRLKLGGWWGSGQRRFMKLFLASFQDRAKF